MRNIILFFISIIYGLMNYYIASKLVKIVNGFLKSNVSIIIYFIISALTLTTLLGFLMTTMNIGIIGRIGMYWFGVVVVSLVLFSISDILLFVISKITKSENNLNMILNFNLIALLVALCIFGYGVYTAQNIKNTQYSIEIKKESAVDSLKVVMFSDLHLGYINDVALLEQVVQKINKINPDIIFISGDFFDGNFNALQNQEKARDLLKTLTPEYGTYLAWGNHDAGDSFEKMQEFALSANIKILEDEVFVIQDMLSIIGRKDATPIGNQGILRQNIDDDIVNLEKELPVIVVDHQPSNINEYAYADLVLSGHTHQGQIFPGNLITRHIYTVDYGYYKMNEGTHIIVSSGVGTWGPPMRLGTVSEIVEIDIAFVK